MRAIILPGLDGTAGLRRQFAAALAPHYQASVLAYPIDKAMDYAALTPWVLARLPTDEPFVLIAESFAGPLAIRVAAARPAGLVRLVLSTTFARPPRPALAPLRGLVRWLPMQRPPMTVVNWLMLGRWSTPAWRHRLQAAIAGVPDEVLRARLRAAAAGDAIEALAQVACPVLYLQATHDRLVPPSAWECIRAHCAQARRVRIEGPHMLLQARPESSAQAIKR